MVLIKTKGDYIMEIKPVIVNQKDLIDKVDRIYKDALDINLDLLEPDTQEQVVTLIKHIKAVREFRPMLDCDVQLTIEPPLHDF